MSLLPSKLDRDRDTSRAGVDRILDQLLHHRCGAFDDLSGGNLIGKVTGKHPDSGHAQIHLFNRNTNSIRTAIAAIIAPTHQN